MSMYRLVALGAIVAFFVFFLAYYWSVEKEQQPQFVALLFAVGAVPLIVQVFLLDEKSKLGTMTGFTICTSGLILGGSWAIYTFWIDGSDVRQEGMSLLLGSVQWLDFGWSFVLVAFTLHMTALVLKGQRIEATSTRSDVSSSSSGASYETSSDDDSVSSIENTTVRTIDDEESKKIGHFRRFVNSYTHPHIKAEIQRHPVFSMLILFSVLLHVTYSLALSLAFHDQRVMGLYVTPLGEKRSVGEFAIQSCRISEINRLTTQFSELTSGSRVKDSSRMIRVIVEGAVSAIDQSMDGRTTLQRNYEAHCLNHIIRDLGNEINLRTPEGVEWLFRTSIYENGSSASPAAPVGALNSSAPSRLRITAIYGKDQGARPQLLDYVYFMIYTIVTTGYGDLVPASPFAKLVCALANIFEQFFSVIFFGVFLSFIGALGWSTR